MNIYQYRAKEVKLKNLEYQSSREFEKNQVIGHFIVCPIFILIFFVCLIIYFHQGMLFGQSSP